MLKGLNLFRINLSDFLLFWTQFNLKTKRKLDFQKIQPFPCTLLNMIFFAVSKKDSFIMGINKKAGKKFIFYSVLVINLIISSLPLHS